MYNKIKICFLLKRVIILFEKVIVMNDSIHHFIQDSLSSLHHLSLVDHDQLDANQLDERSHAHSKVKCDSKISILLILLNYFCISNCCHG